MRGELIQFILEHQLTLFEETKTSTTLGESIYKTKDAKAIHQRVLNHLSTDFAFSDTSTLWNYFSFTKNFSDIQRRQTFFSNLGLQERTYLKQLQKPKKTWKPKYDVVVVTEDESSFLTLKNLGCPVLLLMSPQDCQELEQYDIVQVVDCEQYETLLERLPQSVFLTSVEDVYLERYVEELSGWKHNYDILKAAQPQLCEELRLLITGMPELFDLMDDRRKKILSETYLQEVLEGINEKVFSAIKSMTITGEGLLKILGEGKIPAEILNLIRTAISDSGLQENLFNMHIPVTIDQKELEEQLKRQNTNEYTDTANAIKRHASRLKQVPTILSALTAELLVEDFSQGITRWIKENNNLPYESEKLELIDSQNMFLQQPQPISFQLTKDTPCSILTGANSGGKTTLLEHLIQGITLYHLGLGVSGKFTSPHFTEVYYFAKNKGSASKGAFETLLTYMAKIKPGNNTLILADEIEAVTEPGVAGKIISATAQYFINKKCFLVLATHLGHEIQKNLPTGARIDGIEATGLDENFELLVNHNPILGKLAHSTPELIVQRMAQAYQDDYFIYLHQHLKSLQ